MKAVVMPTPGGPEVLEEREVADPVRSDERDLLIRLKAAGINPVDTKMRGGGSYGSGGAPVILGCDGAGVVEEAGPGCQRFQPGDAVYFFNGGIGTEPGNYAEYTVVDERFVAAKPAALSFAEAAAVPLVAITAWESLFDRGNLQSGENVLVHAGAGGVGHMAIQLARRAGAEICTTVGSEEKAAFVRELGADKTIPYKEVDFVDAVLACSDQRGVDLALDTVGPEVLEASFPAVRFYGRAVTLLDPKGISLKQARLRNLGVFLELMLSPLFFGLAEARAHQAKILGECARLFDAGELRIHLHRTFPLAEAAEAHRLLEEGHMQGKAVLTME
ncbi:zinc-dependent alcohol dehydrogenase family protein [Thiohalorhabdus methylotrophus]|uniref:Zinc-dependent alcohol dehydrogenase family protein n=1 Tax=Thiohalorhabdus methylotrophus TaxID=3242694 RepID=A0ABV4U0D4_9GAMM